MIVVGAGLAGLSAAYKLRQAGHDVVVLEARSRAGGRVRTLRHSFPGGTYAEAGAVLIPSSHDAVLKYVRHFDLDLKSAGPESFEQCYFVDGDPSTEVTATRNVKAVLKDGRKVDRRSLFAPIQAKVDAI